MQIRSGPPRGALVLTALALVALALLPPAAGRPGEASFTAKAFSAAAAKPAPADGFLIMRQSAPAGPAEGNRTAGTSFELEAERLWVETSEAQFYSNPGSASESTSTRTTHAFYNRSVLLSTVRRLESDIAILPDGGPGRAALALGCGSLSPSDLPPGFATVGPQDHIGARDRQHPVDVSNAVLATPCPATKAEFRGDLLLVLWEWDAQLSAREGNAVLESGFFRHDNTSGTWGHAQQHYIHARNATLTLRAPAGAMPDFYLSSFPFANLTQATLGQATGWADGGDDQVALDLQDIQLEGTLAGRVRKGGDGALQVLVTSGLRRIVGPGGQTLLDTSLVAPQPSRSWAWLWLAGVATVATLGPAAMYARGRRVIPAGGLGSKIAAGHSFSADLCLDANHPRLALLHSSLARLWAPATPEGLEVRIQAFKAVGRHADALRLHHRLNALAQGDPGLVAENAIEAAATCCKLGRLLEAVHWLQVAEQQDAARLRGGLERHEFAVLGSDPWFRAASRPAPGDESYS